MPPKYILHYLLFIVQQYINILKLPENLFCLNNTHRKIIIVTLPGITFILKIALKWWRGILEWVNSMKLYVWTS